MHDFFCTRPEDMINKNLSETVRFYKEDEKGVRVMCRAIEEMRNEVYLAAKKEDALALIALGKLSLEDIAKSLSMPFEFIQELAFSKEKA